MVFYRRRNQHVHDELPTPVDSARGGPPVPADNANDELFDHLRALGLAHGATWEEITEAHRRLVSDLTPGPGASHKNVALAQEYLDEVNEAYNSLQRLVAVA